MKKVLLIFVVSTLFSSNNFAQTTNDYLSSAEIQMLIDNETDFWKLQDYAVLFSEIGNYKASLAAEKLFLKKNKAAGSVGKVSGEGVDFGTFKPKNAVNAITNAAKNYQVVITNEAHYQPQNRVFTALLLEKLYRNGFRYFAVEDLYIDDLNVKSKEDKELNKRKYPLKTSGFYLSEPQYGNLVRQALKIGYTLIAYEHYASDVQNPTERILARERGQAKNIAEILKKDSQARVLVHCGYGHLSENLINGRGLMAAMLKKDFQIDPLTVDQEALLEEKNNPYFNLTKLAQPSVYVSGDVFFNNSGTNRQVDMVVFFPKTKYVNGRPDWLRYDKTRRFFFAQLASRELSYPVMIFAYLKGEDVLASVPADIVEIKQPGEKTALVLDKGQYVLRIKDAAGNTFERAAKVR